ncbi:Restriction endonuclease type IV Mrr domain-containing protein [Candidatus Electrothrix laxa]
MPLKKSWESYEEVATYLLNQFADHFGLECVEGKQCVTGASGTDWEIDAKGVSDNGEGFIIVECKRRKNRLNQAILGSLAYSIKDTGAQGGIVVTPIDLQKGAKKIAAHENIHHVILDPSSTISQYVLRFLNKVCFGLSMTVGVDIAVRVRAVSADEMKAIELCQNLNAKNL